MADQDQNLIVTAAADDELSPVLAAIRGAFTEAVTATAAWQAALAALDGALGPVGEQTAQLETTTRAAKATWADLGDTAPAVAGITRMQETLSAAHQQLLALSQTPHEVRVDAQISSASTKIQSLERELERLLHQPQTADIQIQTERAELKLKALTGQISEIGQPKTPPSVNLDTAPAEGALNRLKSAAESVASTIGGTLKESLAGAGGALQSAGSHATGFFEGIGGGIAKIGMMGMGLQFLATTVGGVTQALVGGNEEMENYVVGFATLLGSEEAAKQRMAELTDFAAKTPFELPEVAKASRVLQVFGGDVLATGKNLTMIGDIASGVQQPFDDVAMWVGRAYDAIQSGRPWGEAAMRLQEMGAMSGATRSKLEDMQKAGKDGSAVWAEFTQSMSGFSGMMEKQSHTATGLLSTIADDFKGLLRTLTLPLFDKFKEGLEGVQKVIEAPSFQVGIQVWGERIGELLPKIISLFERLGAIVGPVFDVIGRLAGPVVDALGQVADALGKLLQGDWSGAGQAIGQAIHGLGEAAWDAFGGLVQDALVWGQKFIASFADGITAGIAQFVQPAIDFMGGELAGLMEPHSPPAFLPNLDKWGTAAAQVYLDGWTAADFSALDTMGSAVKEHLTSLVNGKALGQAAADGMLTQARAALREVEGEFQQFGQVGAAAWDRLRASVGPAGDGVLLFVRAELQLQQAHQATAAAQAQLTAVQDAWKAKLDDVAASLKRLGDAEQAALGRLPDDLKAAQGVLSDMRAASEAALHPLDVQLHVLEGDLARLQQAGTQALVPFDNAVAIATQSVAWLEQAAKDALAPFDADLQAANADLQALRDQARATQDSFATLLQPLQDQLAGLKQAESDALAPLDASIQAAKDRVDDFRNAAAGIAARYDAQLAPLLAQMQAIKATELGHQHRDDLHDLGLSVENLEARLKNAIPGTAEYTELQYELAKAKEHLSDKQKEFGLQDQIDDLQTKKDAEVKAAEEKAKLAEADLQQLERQRQEIQRTYQAQEQAVERQIQDLDRARQASQQSDQARQQAAERHIADIERAKQAEAARRQAEIDGARAVLVAAQTAETNKKALVDAGIAAKQRDIDKIREQHDTQAWADGEAQRGQQLVIDGLNRQITTIQTSYDRQRASLQAQQQNYQDLARTATDAAQAAVKAASDHEKALQDEAAALQASLHAAAQDSQAQHAAAAAHGAAAHAASLNRAEHALHPPVLEAHRSKLAELHDKLMAARDAAETSRTGFNGFLADLRDKWTAAVGWVSGEITHFQDLVREKGIAHAIIQEITEKWAVVQGWLDQLGHAAWQWLVTVGPQILQAAGTAFHQVITYLNGPFLTDIVQQGGILAGAAIRWLADLVNNIPIKLQEIENRIAAWFVSLLPTTKEGWDRVIKGIFDGIEELGKLPDRLHDWAVRAVQTFINGFLDGFGIHSPSTKMIEIAGHIIDGLVQGLRDGVGHVGDAIGDLGGKALDGLKAVFGIHSPSTETHEMGTYLLQGLTGGMQAGQAALQAMFTTMGGALTTFGTQARQLTQVAAGGIVASWQGATGPITQAFLGLFGPVQQDGTLLNLLAGHQATSFFQRMEHAIDAELTWQKYELWGSDLMILREFLQQTFTKIAQQIQPNLHQLGQSIADGIAKGIKDNAGVIAQAVRGAIDDAMSAGAAAAESHSPSERSAREVGKPIAEGVRVGIDRHAHEAEGSMRRLVTTATGVPVPGGAGAPGGMALVGAGAAGGVGGFTWTGNLIVQAGVGPDGRLLLPKTPQEWLDAGVRPLFIAFQQYQGTKRE